MAGTYRIYVSGDFSAAHRLPGHPGPCAATHGHNFAVTAELAASTLTPGGMVADFADVKKALDAATAELDHTCVNDHPDFALTPPTAENLAAWIFARLKAALGSDRLRVARVTVVESQGLGASYEEAP